MKFKATVIPSGNALGVEVPQEVVDGLGQGKRPPVVVAVNGHSWRTRIAAMRGQILIGISAANREASGVDLGEEIEVDVQLDDEPRVVEAPDDLAAVLDADPALRGRTSGWRSASSASRWGRSRARRVRRRGSGGSRSWWSPCGASRSWPGVCLRAGGGLLAPFFAPLRGVRSSGRAGCPGARCLSAGRPQLVAPFPAPLKVPLRGNPLGAPQGRI
ncbi:uncharacterized protein DUF1905 [Streptomyces sp. TLI_146]|nr:uncharacterized protein DUF1905 [Streptomyces sp. TLI_146]